MRPCPSCYHVFGRLPIPPSPPSEDYPHPAFPRIMLIGEGPAKDEDRLHAVFSGRAGQELNLQYLPLAHLYRSQVWITNARKCSSARYDNPSLEDAASCAACHLSRELAEFQPDLIVALGGVACSLFRLDYSTHPGEAIDLELHHGLSHPAYYHADPSLWRGILWPSYHPAAGLRSSPMMIPLQESFRSLRRFLEGQFSWAPRVVEDCDYRELSTPADLAQVLDPQAPDLMLDTESLLRDYSRSLYDPLCLTFSQRPGTGYLIRFSHAPVLAEFNRWAREARPYTAIHNWTYDAPILLDHGFPLDYRRSTDTMMRAYHLGNLPQGLKVLGFRLLGVQMEDYEDLVHPFSRERVHAWAGNLIPKLFPLVYRHKLTTKGLPSRAKDPWERDPAVPVEAARLYTKLKGLYRRLSLTLEGERPTAETPLADLVFDPRSEEDPWELYWGAWHPHDRDWCEALAGPPPLPSLEYVPWPRVVRYACRDADVGLQVLHELRKRNLRRERMA